MTEDVIHASSPSLSTCLALPPCLRNLKQGRRRTIFARRIMYVNVTTKKIRSAVGRAASPPMPRRARVHVD